MRWRLDPGQIEVVDEDVAAVLRTKSAAERIAIATAAHRTARLMTEAQVRRMLPGLSDEEVAREVARRLSRGAG
jgi:hypothetical protein